MLGSKNVGQSTLNSIRQDIAIEQRSASWKYIFATLGVLAVVIIAVAGIYIVLTQYMLMLKTCILNILMCTLPELVLRMILLPLTTPAPNQQPLLEPIH